MPEIRIKTSELLYSINTGSGLSTKELQLSTVDKMWITKGGSPEFILHCNGRQYLSSEKNFRFAGHTKSQPEPGVTQHKIEIRNHYLGVEVNIYIRFFEGTNVIEKWGILTNKKRKTLKIDRLDTFCLKLTSSPHQLCYFTSGWAREFNPVIQQLAGTIVLQSASGRSSSQTHPWFALENNERGVLIGSLAHSGNWIFRFEPQEDGTYLISGGINPWQFSKTLKTGESFEGAHAIIALGAPGDIDNAAIQLQRWGRKYWYPKNEFAESCPVEWNHWWFYEDRTINSAIFKQNVDIAAQLGVEACVLDAGWFGKEGKNWGMIRGDWHIVNDVKFPEGILHLANYVHSKGMKFGIWCEIEAIGEHAELNRMHPEFVQKHDGKSLGAICFGNPDAVEWAFGVIERLINDYRADWLKFDFNIDLDAGCNCTDHGHQSGDGLYEHYRGLYRLLEKIRAKYPHVLLENCSSGGLRIDLGMMKYESVAYLSDPDMPVHSLQIFWGATMMLAPSACLHWLWSDCNGIFNPLKLYDGKIEDYRLDYYARISMLNVFGLAHPLPLLPTGIKEKLAEHIRFYKEKVKKFVQEADLYHLTDQPRRDYYRGVLCAFEYLMPSREEALVFIFRTPGSLMESHIKFKSLLPDRKYTIKSESAEINNVVKNSESFPVDQPDSSSVVVSGSCLLYEGLDFSFLREEESATGCFRKGCSSDLCVDGIFNGGGREYQVCI